MPIPADKLPPVITDIRLSPDDRFRYVSCWATGQLLQYGVTGLL